MLASELINPISIAVIGGSNNLQKPGGKILQNLLEGNFGGELYVVNPGEELVQGLKCYPDTGSLPQTDLAILAIAAKYCPDAVEVLIREKGTRGFIILSAGFGEESEEGRAMEKHIVSYVETVGGSLIGPNCIGVINQNYRGVFTSPIPKLNPKGCDFISGSGATAVFIMEAGIPKGLTFSSVWSVGNSAQTGVEDVLEHLDETFDPDTSSRVKLLYIETIEKPDLLLKHASSLHRKGCRIAAIKSGTTEAGSRAASSHTGALASPDSAVEALFRKAGIVRCNSREELVAVASVFQHKKLEGNRIAIITHAGGPAVMLTDVLSEGGFEIPHIDNPASKALLEKLHPGSSVANPIDILATGRTEQLELAIDYCERDADQIDGMIVIFGTPGMFRVNEEYRIIHEKMNSCRKPIYPVLPSIVNAKEEIAEFLSYGRINFPDEVTLGRALVKTRQCSGFFQNETIDFQIDENSVRKVIEEAGKKLKNLSQGNGFEQTSSPRHSEGVPDPVSGCYLEPGEVRKLLDAAGIPRAEEAIANSKTDAVLKSEEIGFPVAMKVVGPLHKSDAGGVMLNISSAVNASDAFEKLMNIEGSTAVLIQPMLMGTELFAGVKKEGKFGHLVLCGLGGIFIEVMKDTSVGLAPVSRKEGQAMIRALKSYPLIQGVRGKEGVDEDKFIEILMRLSLLVKAAPEIIELDLNPLLGTRGGVTAVDARVRIAFN